MAKKKVKENRVIAGTRRNNGEGSIYQRKDGRWSGAVTLGYDDGGKVIRKHVYSKSRAEVSQKLSELSKRIISDNYDYIEKNNLSKLMKEWLLIFKKNSVTPRTFEGNFRNYELHIEPAIGNMKLYDITHLTLQKLLNEKLSNGLGLTTVKKVKFLLSQFFEYAVENNFIASNPINKTKIKSTERKIYDGENKYKAIPQEIRDEFIEKLKEHDLLNPLCLCMMFAGLRTGEVLALTWNNINFEDKTIQVEKGVTTMPRFDEYGKITERITVVSDTKTACSVREVPMPNILVDAFEKYKQRQWLIGKEKNINLLASNVYVFANDDGSVRTYSGTKKIFERFLKKYDFKKYKIHFHGLRHTYSNMLFEANENPKVIQSLLGHKSVKTTITTYNSVDKSYFKQAVDVLNNKYDNVNNEKTNTLEQEKNNITPLMEKLKLLDLELLEEILKEKQEVLAKSDSKVKKKSDMEM